VLIPFSAIMVGLSIFAFFNRGSDKYDIEFTGGTSVQINLRPDVSLDRTKVETMLADRGLQARVYSVGESKQQYEINTTETNKTTAAITFAEGSQTIDTVTAAITAAQESFSGELNRLNVQQDKQNPAVFVISTSQVNKSLVKDILAAAVKDKKAVVSEPTVDEIVNNAINAAFGDMLATQKDLRPSIVSVDKLTDTAIEAAPELTNFLGGIRIAVKTETPVAAGEIISRFKDLRFKPDGQNLAWYQDSLLTTDNRPLDPNAMISAFVYVSVLPDAGFRQISNEEQGMFIDNEKTKVLAAASLESSLPRVTQIDPSLGSQAKVRGLIAIVLAFLAIIVYVWVRFGASRYGFAGVLALVHDVIIATGAVVVCTWVVGSGFGNALLIGDFKINLDIIAALLTIIGFSINDTIVIFDRIRENRGRGGILTPEIINNSINQTMSRTILTTFTAFLVVLIMYIWGGSGLRGFNFTLLIGMISGTYSTIAIAAPIVLLQKKVKWN
jgi:SecD/SecF fusion protein